MPEKRERDPYNNVMDFFEMFIPNLSDFAFQTGFVDNEGNIRESTLIRVFGTPRDKFTREERQMLNKLKEQAEDVEFEEIQG